MLQFFNTPLFRTAAALVLVAAAPLSWAHDRADLSWSLSIGSPRVYSPPPVVYAPPPVVYVQPEPVYVRPRPVYVQPVPVVTYSQPYYVDEGRYWRHRHHHH